MRKGGREQGDHTGIAALKQDVLLLSQLPVLGASVAPGSPGSVGPEPSKGCKPLRSTPTLAVQPRQFRRTVNSGEKKGKNNKLPG